MSGFTKGNTLWRRRVDQRNRIKAEFIDLFQSLRAQYRLKPNHLVYEMAERIWSEENEKRAFKNYQSFWVAKYRVKQAA